MMIRRLAPAAVIAAALAFGPVGASAQSLFGTGGLGVPVPPVDARARALGTGVGLVGLNTSLINPAESGGFLQKGFSGTLQPVSRDIDLGGGSSSVSGTRFPLMRLLYPLGGRAVLSLSYGGFLEQSWSVRSEELVELGGENVRAVDLHQSEGGIGQARLGLAIQVRPGLSVGVAGGLYTGELDRSLTRTFPDSAQAGVREFSTTSRWTYGAPLAAVGVRWDPVPAARVGAALTWSGDLDADGRDDAPDHEFGLPLRLDAGASAYLSPQLAVAVGGGWAGWGDTAEVESSSGTGEDMLFPTSLAARDTWSVGGGVEWSGVRTDTRTWPVRLGYNYAKLPFAVAGEAPENAPSERTFAFGLGLRMSDEETGPRALVDATLERGSMSAPAGSLGELSESFWRLSVSLALFGR